MKNKINYINIYYNEELHINIVNNNLKEKID